MISLSDAARKELDAFFSGNPDAKKSVRVFPAPGGCCGPTLSMALDDADDNDVSEEIGGVTYCMTKELYEAIGNISVDLSYLGFAIVSERPVPDMGGSCISVEGVPDAAADATSLLFSDPYGAPETTGHRILFSFQRSCPMFTVTPKAKKELDDFFAANSDCGKASCILPGTCGGPTATMTLDKADAEYDVSEEVDGIVFCMTKPLFAMVGNVTVDVGTGFVVRTDHPFVLGPSDHSCGGSCGSCSGCGF